MASVKLTRIHISLTISLCTGNMGRAGRPAEPEELADQEEVGGDAGRVVLHLHLARVVVARRARHPHHLQGIRRHQRDQLAAHALHLRPRLRLWAANLGPAVGDLRPRAGPAVVEPVLSRVQHRLRLLADSRAADYLPLLRRAGRERSSSCTF